MPKKTKAKSKHPANNFYSLSELKTFLECAKKYKEKYYVYFMTVGNLGCRPGEALALKVEKYRLQKQGNFYSAFYQYR